MKKLVVTLCLSALATAAFAQGTVAVANSGSTLFRTNSLATGGTSGNTANGAPSAGGISGGFQYEILTAPSSVTSVDTSLQQLLSGPWSDTGLTLTNATLASGGRVNGRSGVTGQVGNWAPGAFQSYVIVGWSAGEGADWNTLKANLLGAQLTSAGGGQMWGQSSNGQLVTGGFIGASSIQSAASGPPDGSAPWPLFGSTGGAAGTPITTPSTLWIVNVPEPTSFALLGLGTAALVIFRRRKA